MRKGFRCLLDEGDFTQSKTFLRSFVKKIIVDGDRVKIEYRLPMPADGKMVMSLGVLPIERGGGAEGGRTPYLFNAIESLSQLSYSPNSQLYQNIP